MKNLRAKRAAKMEGVGIMSVFGAEEAAVAISMAVENTGHDFRYVKAVLIAQEDIPEAVLYNNKKTKAICAVIVFKDHIKEFNDRITAAARGRAKILS